MNADQDTQDELSEGDTVRFRKNGVRTGEVSTVHGSGFGPDLMVSYEGRKGGSVTTAIDFGDVMEVDP